MINMRKIKIEGMGCEKCVAHVKEALEGLGLTDIQVSLSGGYAEFEGEVDDAALKEAIEDAGYDLV